MDLIDDFLKTKKGFREFFEMISPILIKPTATSLTIGLSKRFLLFQFINQVARTIEDDPHLNFISLLKYYKVMGKFLEGTIREFYRDRHKFYFKDFFVHDEVYNRIRSDLEHVYTINPDVKMTISKQGIVIYDNYKRNKFNILLMTMHSGTYVPKDIEEKMSLTPRQRYREEDVESDRLYCRLVLEQGGIWVDNKFSRFYCDLNRHISNSIYHESKETTMKHKKLWERELSKSQLKKINDFYIMFYSMLTKLLESYNFNIIFDGHTMKNYKGRPDMSFGTHYIPKFYLPIVKSMRTKLRSIGYENIGINDPYEGGFILRWLSVKFPDLFVFSMEINKSAYMSKNMVNCFYEKIDKISRDLVKIIDITEEEGFRYNKPPTTG